MAFNHVKSSKAFSNYKYSDDDEDDDMAWLDTQDESGSSFAPELNSYQIARNQLVKRSEDGWN